jgi:predicted metal-dependent phosphoesterase TrpH
MSVRNRCWVIEGTDLRPSDAAALRGYRSWVSLHNHSRYSTENIASLNWVVKLWYMRPLARPLQCAFGLASGERLDYREVTYHPMVTPDALRLVEQDKARQLGLSGLIFAVTDHDEIQGGLELLAQHPEKAKLLPVGVELSIPFNGHLFHLGVTGLPPATAAEEHAGLQAACGRGDHDRVFDRLRRLGCLVVLNHPVLPWSTDGRPDEAASSLLARYGPGIDALEFNAMRTIDENRRVLELARRVGKPIIGGGDSHLLLAGAAGCATQAESFDEFADEVRSGRTTTVVTRDYFSPLGWKLTLRVVSFMAEYRAIAHFRGQPVSRILRGRRVALDPVGRAAGWFLKAVRRLGRLS